MASDASQFWEKPSSSTEAKEVSIPHDWIGIISPEDGFKIETAIEVDGSDDDWDLIKRGYIEATKFGGLAISTNK